jgi:hypothetical protein
MTLLNDERSRKLLAELSSALTARTNEAAIASEELRDAVCEYVSAEQARGTKLDTILAAVKQLLAKAEGVADFSSESMAGQLMDWCLEFHSRRAATSLPPLPTA